MNVACFLRNPIRAAAILLGLMAFASSPAFSASMVAFSGAINRSGDVQGPFQIGNDFNVTDPLGITITQLGFFDDGFNGLTKAHNVALYNRASTALPLATLSIPLGTTFDSSDGPYTYTNAAASASANKQTIGGYRYMNLATPIFLASGFQGSIVGYNLSDTGGNVDDYGEFVNFGPGASAEITFPGSRFTQTATSAGFPTANSSTEMFGDASFAFTPAPEPGSIGLIATGALGLLARRRRQCGR